VKLVLFMTTFIFGLSAWAGNGPLLLGAVIGDPTGLSARYDLGSRASVDGAFSWSSGTRSGSQIHVDYLVSQPSRIAAGDSFLDLFYGIGARLIALSSGGDKGKFALGPRAPLGLKYELQDPSVEFFGEIALILDIVPSTTADFDLGVGARYRF
jgi:hypothetical protein